MVINGNVLPFLTVGICRASTELGCLYSLLNVQGVDMSISLSEGDASSGLTAFSIYDNS